MTERFSKAKTDIAAGDFWRAKERLRGALGSGNFDAELYTLYGYVLLEMRDVKEAGRYLFWSGTRGENTTGAISIFLSGFKAKPTVDLLRTLPRKSCSAGIASLPAIVQDDLQNIGATKSELDNFFQSHTFQKHDQPAATRNNLTVPEIFGTVAALGFFALVLSGFLAAAAFGIGKIFDWFS